MPDSAAIDAALFTLLLSDQSLLTLLPDQVYPDQAPPGSKRFGIVTLIDEVDALSFEGRAFENALYLVKAVVRTDVFNAGALTRDAAARIDALLERAVLVADGYTHMACFREARIRYTEIDDGEPTHRWYHRGGQYRVVMST